METKLKKPIFTFYTDSISCKTVEDGDEKRYFVEGYASTEDLDLVGDIVTKECMKSMLKQIIGKTVTMKLDQEHEAYKEDTLIIPTGKVIDARIEGKRLFIKAELNRHLARFKSLWGSIKDGFIDAFSITYKTLKSVKKTVEGKATRLLQEVLLLNIALTGNPANPEAKITAVMAKSLAVFEEERNMAEEENKEVQEEETKENEGSEESTTEETEKKEEVDMKDLIARLDVLEAEKKEHEAVKEKNEALAVSVKELSERLEKAEEALTKPMIKSTGGDTPPTTAPAQSPTPLQAI